MSETPAEYAAYPAGTVLQQDYAGCYAIDAFSQYGVKYVGTEAQPAFTAEQRKEIEWLGGIIFDSPRAFVKWRSS